MANVLLIIDMLRGFRDIGNLRNPLMEKIIPNIVELSARKQREGWNIIFLGDCHHPDDAEFEIFPAHCIAGTEETEVIPELQPFLKKYKSNYLPKKRYSGFFETHLEVLLQKEAPLEIIVVGVCTDICVKYTVEELRNRGHRVKVIADCVTTYHIPEMHDAAEVNAYELRHLQNILGAEIIPTQSEI